MKKILISIIGFILLILIIVAVINGIRVMNFSINSIKGIKYMGKNLDDKIQEAEVEKSQNYAKAVNDANKAITDLKNAKEEYEAKVQSLGLNSDLGITQIEKYKIEYLWNKIGSYARNHSLKIDLDIEETSISETYNIKFTLTGSYVGITDFLYDIENDDELNYKVIMWSKDTIDWRDKDQNKVYSRATNGVTNGDLILMHPKEHTLKALPSILAYYKSIGLDAVSVSDNLT
jgi:hypothetical protein